LRKLGIPMAVGIGFPLHFLASFLLGMIVTGYLLSSMQASAGGAWDNAKVCLFVIM
jgi:Na+/H+-translocating membrane pyrophosphatase